jgi:hypothetical protein
MLSHLRPDIEACASQSTATATVFRWLVTSLVICASLVTGCQTANLKVLPGVGPQSGNLGGDIGYLMVYSATEEYNDGDSMYYPHSSYQLYTGNGRYLKTVHNKTSKTDEVPERIRLQPGRYIIHADSEPAGRVAVPVIIAPGRATIVNLEATRRG